MEVHFTPATKAQLDQFAASEGKDAAQLVEETIVRLLERRAQLIDGVERGIAAADRGDLIDDDEVLTWLEQREHT